MKVVCILGVSRNLVALEIGCAVLPSFKPWKSVSECWQARKLEAAYHNNYVQIKRHAQFVRIWGRFLFRCLCWYLNNEIFRQYGETTASWFCEFTNLFMCIFRVLRVLHTCGGQRLAKSAGVTNVYYNIPSAYPINETVSFPKHCWNNTKFVLLCY